MKLGYSLCFNFPALCFSQLHHLPFEDIWLTETRGGTLLPVGIWLQPWKSGLFLRCLLTALLFLFHSPAFPSFLAPFTRLASVDDRTPQELGEQPLTTDRRVISKSRYDSVSSYLSLNAANLPEYQDIPLEMDDNIYQQLIAGGEIAAAFTLAESVGRFSED